MPIFSFSEYKTCDKPYKIEKEFSENRRPLQKDKVVRSRYSDTTGQVMFLRLGASFSTYFVVNGK